MLPGAQKRRQVNAGTQRADIPTEKTAPKECQRQKQKSRPKRNYDGLRGEAGGYSQERVQPEKDIAPSFQVEWVTCLPRQDKEKRQTENLEEASPSEP